MTKIERFRLTDICSTRIWNCQVACSLGEEVVKASISTQLVGNGLVISVDSEHETRMDLIVSASATHLVTQVGATCYPR